MAITIEQIYMWRVTLKIKNKKITPIYFVSRTLLKEIFLYFMLVICKYNFRYKT